MRSPELTVTLTVTYGTSHTVSATERTGAEERNAASAVRDALPFLTDRVTKMLAGDLGDWQAEESPEAVARLHLDRAEAETLVNLDANGDTLYKGLSEDTLVTMMSLRRLHMIRDYPSPGGLRAAVTTKGTAWLDHHRPDRV